MIPPTPSTYCEYGYFDVAVYASNTHFVRPSTTTGYGSVSKRRNGASLVTRSRIDRYMMIFDLPGRIWPDTSRFTSLNRSANAARRTKPLRPTPSAPRYRVVASRMP